MTTRPTAVILSFAELGPAYREMYERNGRPDEQAQPLPVRFVEASERTQAAIASLKPSDSETE
jgi:hypothetical protein